MNKILPFLVLLSASVYCQNIAFDRLYSNGDPNSYYLGHYPVTGSDGLNIYWHGGIKLSTGAGTAMQIHNTNVGIGTDGPKAKLDITFPGEPKNILFMDVPNGGNPVNSMISRMRFSWYNDTADFGMVRSGSYPIEGLAINFNNEEKIRFSSNGNVGIGTHNPTNKLDVNGTIHAKEVKVDAQGWSDFVFNSDYQLPPLAEVERHIKEKGHLPNIPSEQEVLEKGINIAEMDARLLQKIEELTLYSIEQNKALNLQAEKIKELERQNKLLQGNLSEIEALKEQLNQLAKKRR